MKHDYPAVINRLLKEKGMTQAQLAKDAGISAPGLSSVMNGHSQINLVRLEKVAKVLGVDLWKIVKEATE